MPEARKPFWRRILEFRLLFLVNAIVLIALALSFGREWMRNREIREQIAALQSQADALETRNLEIADLNTAFRTQSFIEREARLKLGLKKPGENVVIIQSGQTTPVTNTDGETENVTQAQDPRALLAQADAPAEVANPTRWWQYFFH